MPQLPQLILLDLDGTLYIGNQPIPGTVEALAHLRERGIALRFITNTTTKLLGLIGHCFAANHWFALYFG